MNSIIVHFQIGRLHKMLSLVKIGKWIHFNMHVKLGLFKERRNNYLCLQFQAINLSST
nr:MAG TPA: hypothetical protein [Caudoviricetes sp.]